jgi:hypothetical protein
LSDFRGSAGLQFGHLAREGTLRIAETGKIKADWARSRFTLLTEPAMRNQDQEQEKFPLLHLSDASTLIALTIRRYNDVTV